MQTLKMFSVHDQAAGVYMTPFFQRNLQMAQRSFRGLVNNQNSQIAQTPADFTLFEVADFDDEQCLIIPLTTPINHGNGLQFVNRDNDET